MELPILEIKNIKKRYTLGKITGTTLVAQVESWWANIRKKEDPNVPLHLMDRQVGLSFMALNGVSFSVNKGERIGLIGSNGAGKSTLLKILSRITAPTEGEAFLRGRVASMLEVGTGFNPEMTGRENIYLNGAILGMNKTEVDEKIEQIIEFSEVREFIDTPVKRYSSGMFVKLAFAVASHLDSEIVIMDEVLAVGDVQFQQKCLNKMYETSVSEDKTIIYVSHNMATIRQLCNRCVVLSEGKVVFDGDVEKAISVYSSLEEINTKTKDLTSLSRPKLSANLVMMEKIELIDRESATYEKGEKIAFSITFNPKVDYETFMQITIKSMDGITLSTIYTNPKQNQIFKKGEVKTIDFKIDLMNLVEGKYMLDIQIVNAQHERPIADMVNKAMIVEVASRSFEAKREGLNSIIELSDIQTL